MNVDRIMSAAALVVAIVAFGIAAWAVTDNNERDACAKAADLKSATTFGDERHFYLDLLDKHGEDLWIDCVTGH